MQHFLIIPGGIVQNDIEFFGSAAAHGYLAQYAVTLCNNLEALAPRDLDRATTLIRDARTLFVGGNGGSSTIADHWVCDMSKGRWSAGKPAPRIVSLTANTGLLTALANDLAYADVFRAQLEMHGLDFLDCVVLISASGNSPNVVAAAEYAKGRAVPIIAFTGFDGGRLRELATVSLHIPVRNYGVVEDAHQVLMHVIAQVLRPIARPASP